MAIYKYVTAERIDILQSSHIRFTQPSDFNDPFELFPYIKAIADDNFINKQIADLGWTDKYFEEILQEKYVAESKKQLGKVIVPFDFVKDEAMKLMHMFVPFGKHMLKSIFNLNDTKIKEMVLSSIRGSIDDTVGVLSLTEKPDNMNMWAHYADSHKGFVIEFNEKHKFFDQRTKPNELRGHLRKVFYSEERPEIVLYDSNIGDEKNLNNWIEKFIWNKSKNWEHEQEWRMIEVLKECKNVINQGSQKICLFPMPIDCVISIILGCKMSQEYSEVITKLLKDNERYSHIKLKRAIIDERNFQLNII